MMDIQIKVTLLYGFGRQLWNGINRNQDIFYTTAQDLNVYQFQALNIFNPIEIPYVGLKLKKPQ